MKFLRALCVLAVALCVAGSVYAETQSVKVSGDLTMRGILRDNYDYRGSVSEPDITRTLVGSDSHQSFIMSIAEIEVDADLTDNVQTVIRILNQRDWNVAAAKNIAQNTTLAQNGLGGYAYSADEFQVDVDLAYVVLKDFIYSPLTLTIGRQDLWFGKGFIVGLNQQNPTGSLNAPEYTAINSFDAVKAVLDYDPWTITGVYSNIRNNAITANDGVDLWGGNVGYKFDAYKAEAEGYWFFKKDKSVERWGPVKSNNDVHTIGIRGSMDPIDVVTLAAEGAYQFGSFVGNRSQINNRDRSAFAIDIAGELRYFTEKFAWKPKLGIEYVLYSGNEPEENPAVTAGNYEGWDPVYRGKFDSAIREFVGRYYASYAYPSRANYVISNSDAAFTNQHQVVFSGSIQPIESLTLKGNYNLFWTVEDYFYDTGRVGAATNANADPRNLGGFIGQEIDLQANWDYTEDVSFGLLTAWLVPGTKVYRNADKVATDVVGSVKVSF